MLDLVEYIKDEEVKNNTIKAIQSIPEYFWKISASTSGKYHPKFSLGEGGLVRHTRFAVEIALEMFNVIKISHQIEKDIIISSLLLHDGMKCGSNGEHTEKLHPIIMKDFLKELWKDWDSRDKDIILNCIASHMGKWNEKGTLPIPNGAIEEFVHLCDYLASRKIYDKYYKTEDFA